MEAFLNGHTHTVMQEHWQLHGLHKLFQSPMRCKHGSAMLWRSQQVFVDGEEAVSVARSFMATFWVSLGSVQ